jgi:hypothetical protein
VIQNLYEQCLYRFKFGRLKPYTAQNIDMQNGSRVIDKCVTKSLPQFFLLQLFCEVHIGQVPKPIHFIRGRLQLLTQPNPSAMNTFSYWYLQTSGANFSLLHTITSRMKN